MRSWIVQQEPQRWHLRLDNRKVDDDYVVEDHIDDNIRCGGVDNGTEINSEGER